MTGRLLRAEREKFISWAKKLAKQNFMKSIKDYAWKQFVKNHGILEKILYLRRNYKIEINWDNINMQFLGFADMKRQSMKLNGDTLLVNVCSNSKDKYTENKITQYADIIGIMRFSFEQKHLSVTIRHKRTRKIVKMFIIKELNEMFNDNTKEEIRSEESVHVMVIFGNLNNLRRNNFEMTNDTIYIN